ncbi:hypothetical protein KHA93_03010 [Bacillus sp. FJAT-49732]|uniref:Uncharacterized protein n=1 Tax=Lederbergia citrisecunda TaxID=2833583 RepID=A0A942YIS9_9BACI|nr:hypothetical protein [Lederbergia citrisecunda]MBS4198618.1 hypothetical protein [Lederbergia citrisecunda]
MKPITITLKIEGKEKRFVSPSFIPGSLFRRAADITEMIEGGTLDHEGLDAPLAFVSDVFENQFTIDEFEDGIDSRVLIKTVYAVCNFVIGNIEEASTLLGIAEEDTSEEGK